VWTQNSFATCRGSASTLAGGLALNNGTIFYAPQYTVGATTTTLSFASGVYAFNATTGAKLAFQATTPTGRISADANNVYLIESSNKLVARAQSDLHVVWQQPVSGPGDQAPVIANGLIIVGTSTKVQAFSASNGAIAWSSGSLSGVAGAWSSTYQGGSCGTIQIPEASYGPTTTLTAALGSNTLVATANDGIHILSLTDGHEIWKGTAQGATSRVGNPILVNDPTQGPILYVTDYQAVYALKP
jgi:hypothetical protein